MTRVIGKEKFRGYYHKKMKQFIIFTLLRGSLRREEPSLFAMVALIGDKTIAKVYLSLRSRMSHGWLSRLVTVIDVETPMNNVLPDQLKTVEQIESKLKGYVLPYLTLAFK
ncbi:hypothetical protein P0F15_000823 [Vibrio metschnikovii]|nr:hypothetical protein [Vibrio metschnikovii]EKO3696380.1 hypothetical protein [Vibrio metschnikovii]EKO3755078.1 hypothetical protein [Vibrio metschnikovii]EKO3872319.1 hypothetical protein [Vibrio metschnikovii]EKO3882129.1 hypothetical protein [Vibrio metschnikovii]